MARIKQDNNGCWIWQIWKDKDGYGGITFKRKKYKCHQVAYELFIGEIPRGMYVCHSCDVKACCNPLHLFVGTPSDNMKDLWAKQLGPKSLLTGSAKVTESQKETFKHLYYNEKFTQKEIGNMYGLHPSTIGRIVNGKTTHLL